MLETNSKTVFAISPHPSTQPGQRVILSPAPTTQEKHIPSYCVRLLDKGRFRRNPPSDPTLTDNAGTSYSHNWTWSISTSFDPCKCRAVDGVSFCHRRAANPSVRYIVARNCVLTENPFPTLHETHISNSLMWWSSVFPEKPLKTSHVQQYSRIAEQGHELRRKDSWRSNLTSDPRWPTQQLMNRYLSNWKSKSFRHTKSSNREGWRPQPFKGPAPGTSNKRSQSLRSLFSGCTSSLSHSGILAGGGRKITRHSNQFGIHNLQNTPNTIIELSQTNSFRNVGTARCASASMTTLTEILFRVLDRLFSAARGTLDQNLTREWYRPLQRPRIHQVHELGHVNVIDVRCPPPADWTHQSHQKGRPEPIRPSCPAQNTVLGELWSTRANVGWPWQARFIPLGRLSSTSLRLTGRGAILLRPAHTPTRWSADASVPSSNRVCLDRTIHLRQGFRKENTWEQPRMWSQLPRTPYELSAMRGQRSAQRSLPTSIASMAS